jgi:hypothetical protein
MAKNTTKKPKSLSAWFKRSGVHVVPRHKFTEAHFEPYAKAIGSLLLAWNDLHERLSTLFVMAMGIEHFTKSFAIWHRTVRDLGKRQMLKEAVTNMGASQMLGRPKVADEIVWILDVANKLEGFRDDSAHTPLQYASEHSLLTLAEMLTMPNLYDFVVPKVRPNASFANPKAQRLEKDKRDLLVEYRFARERVLVLRDYAIAIDYAWANGQAPWPDRPHLPDRKPSRRSKDRASRQKRK